MAGLVTRGVGTAPWRLRAQVTVHAPAAEIADRVPTYLGITVEPVELVGELRAIAKRYAGAAAP